MERIIVYRSNDFEIDTDTLDYSFSYNHEIISYVTYISFFDVRGYRKMDLFVEEIMYWIVDIAYALLRLIIDFPKAQRLVDLCTSVDDDDVKVGFELTAKYVNIAKEQS